MANTKSAKKATRQIARRTVVNRSRRTRVRTAVRKVEEAIAAGDHSGGAKGHRSPQRRAAQSVATCPSDCQTRQVTHAWARRADAALCSH